MKFHLKLQTNQSERENKCGILATIYSSIEDIFLVKELCMQMNGNVKGNDSRSNETGNGKYEENELQIKQSTNQE